MDILQSGRERLRQLPAHGWLGLGLILVFWPLNWGLSSRMPVTSWGFFPLWLGYILTVDAINALRSGTSLWTRSRRRFIGLFIISAPVWWIFEILNWHVQNWHYVGRELFSDLEYFVLSSISFSTVIPAVFGTAELFAGTGFIRRLPRGPVIAPNWPTTLTFAVLGLLMLSGLLMRPDLFFPVLWMWLYFLMAPVNVWLRNRSLSERSQYGDWRPVIALFLGTLTCGFFWEFWNYFSFPKWVYTVPWADFGHIFEMPLLGYGGYLPFGLELFALYHFVMGLTGRKRTAYITRGLFPPDEGRSREHSAD